MGLEISQGQEEESYLKSAEKGIVFWFPSIGHPTQD